MRTAIKSPDNKRNKRPHRERWGFLLFATVVANEEDKDGGNEENEENIAEIGEQSVPPCFEWGWCRFFVRLLIEGVEPVDLLEHVKGFGEGVGAGGLARQLLLESRDLLLVAEFCLAGKVAVDGTVFLTYLTAKGVEVGSDGLLDTLSGLFLCGLLGGDASLHLGEERVVAGELL